MTPSTTLEEASTEVIGNGAIWPTLTVGHSVPLADVPAVVFDLHGQLGTTHVLAAPGMWLRTRPESHPGFHFGMRLGWAVGTGDLIGFLPFTMPFAGPTLHLQFAHGFERHLGALALTLGGEITWPIAPAAFPYTDEDEEGATITVLPVPIWYLSADLRWDVALGENVALVLGGGVDFPYTEAAVLPTGSIGIRF